MIKVETKFGGNCIEVSGTLSVLEADTVTILRGIYECIKEKDAKAAEEYKETMSHDLIRCAFPPEEIARSVIDALSGERGVDLLKKFMRVMIAEAGEEQEDEADD